MMCPQGFPGVQHVRHIRAQTYSDEPGECMNVIVSVLEVDRTSFSKVCCPKPNESQKDRATCSSGAQVGRSHKPRRTVQHPFEQMFACRIPMRATPSLTGEVRSLLKAVQFEQRHLHLSICPSGVSMAYSCTRADTAPVRCSGRRRDGIVGGYLPCFASCGSPCSCALTKPWSSSTSRL